MSAVQGGVIGRHAVVVGGSMAGLFTAGLLARHFERVTLVERDVLPGLAETRKGVPQGHQTHILLKRGLDIAASLFPGLPEALQAAGTQALDMSADCEWFAAGIWRRRVASGVTMHCQTRPLFEGTVRAKLAALPQVRIVEQQEVASFLWSPDGTRVTGLKVRAPGGEQETAMEAELVVDATGRGSRTPQWLEAMGYPRVEETHLKVDVGYSTRLFRKPPGFDKAWRGLLISPELPRFRRASSIIPVEGERWMVTLSGWLRDYPPTDDAGFLEFTRSMPQPHMYEALRNAEPAGPAVPYRFASSQWRHYERLSRTPEGLLVLGDALCSFNPIYGQGMTSSALQVEALGECLREGSGGLQRRFYERAARLIQMPWSLSTGEDLRLPEVEGRRMPGSGVLHWYGDRYQRLTARDEEAVKTFMQVMHMLKPPTAMFSPRLALKVLTALPSDSELRPGPELLAAPARQAA